MKRDSRLKLWYDFRIGRANPAKKRTNDEQIAKGDRGLAEKNAVLALIRDRDPEFWAFLNGKVAREEGIRVNGNGESYFI